MSRRVLAFICGIALVGVGLASCGAVASSITPVLPVSITVACDDFAGPQRPIVVHKRAELASGQTLNVTLCSNPSTGFSWGEARMSDSGVLALVSHQVVQPKEGVVGAAGAETWTFKALNRGEATVSIDYSQPWEGGEKGVWKFSMDVIVDGTPGRVQTTTPTPVSTPTIPSAPTRTPATASTPTSTPTAATNGSLQRAEYGEVELLYDPSVAEQVSAETVPEKGEAETEPWGVAPKHIRFYFQGYPVTSEVGQPTILVLPVERYAELSPQTRQQIEFLTALLRDKPDLYSIYSRYPIGEENVDDSDYGGVVPQLPPVNARKMLSVKMRYLEFKGGSGVRSVVAFSQAYLPIEASRLLYTFQGLTADGKYYVSATFPVLPGAELPSPPEDWRQNPDVPKVLNEYNDRVALLLDKTEDAGYDPGLGLLDEIITSLTIQ